MKRQGYKLKVTTYCVNKGTNAQYFGLKSVSDNQVLHYAPNNWKTERGALNWAKKKGFEVSDACKAKSPIKVKKTIFPKKRVVKSKHSKKR